MLCNNWSVPVVSWLLGDGSCYGGWLASDLERKIVWLHKVESLASMPFSLGGSEPIHWLRVFSSQGLCFCGWSENKRRVGEGIKGGGVYQRLV